MNRLQKRRLSYLVLLLTGLAAVIYLMLFAMRQNISIYLTPTDLLQGHAKDHHKIRLGGVVVNDSIKHFISDPLLIEFDLTDYKKEVTVSYHGVLPDLFRQGQGIVASGYWGEDGVFVAQEVLAKHNETYRPPGIGDPKKGRYDT